MTDEQWPKISRTKTSLDATPCDEPSPGRVHLAVALRRRMWC
jgi:hypothetical protein